MRLGLSPNASLIGPSGIAPAVRTTMRYVDTLALSSTTTPDLSEIYQINGLYDPYYPSGGHQPMNYDVMSTIYKRYIVYGARVTITGTSSGNGYVGLVPHTQSSDLTGSSLAEIKERGGSLITTWVPSPNAGQKLSRYFNVAEMYGVSSDRVSINTDFDAYYTANPTQQAFVTVITQAVDLASAQAVTGLIEIDFDCVWYDRNITSTN